MTYSLWLEDDNGGGRPIDLTARLPAQATLEAQHLWVGYNPPGAPGLTPLRVYDDNTGRLIYEMRASMPA